MSVISTIGQSIEGATSLYVNQTSAAIISAITPLVAIGVTIWIINYGLAVTRGQAQAPVMDFTWKAIKISMILGVGLSVGTYQNQIVPLVNETFSGLSAIVTTSTSADCSFPLSNVYALLDCEYVKPLNFLINLVVAASQASIGQMVGAIILVIMVGVPVYLGCIIFFLVASLEVFYCRLAVQLLLGIGPFFICALAFEPTKKYFDGWIGKIGNLIIFSMLVFAWLGIATTTLESLIKQELGSLVNAGGDVFQLAINPSQSGNATAAASGGLSLIASGFEIFFGYVLFAWIGTMISGIASALSGIASSGSAGAFVAGALSRAALGSAGEFGKRVGTNLFGGGNKNGGSISDNSAGEAKSTPSSKPKYQQAAERGRAIVRSRNRSR